MKTTTRIEFQIAGRPAGTVELGTLDLVRLGRMPLACAIERLLALQPAIPPSVAAEIAAYVRAGKFELSAAGTGAFVPVEETDRNTEEESDE